MVIYNILLFLIVLGVLIIVHEFGHFLIAKLSGVKVEAFSVGFGPSLVKKQIGETLYKVSLIPVGGYVKMAGETHADSKEGADWEFVSQPAWKRFLILTSGPMFNYFMAILIFIILFTVGVPLKSTEIGKVLDEYPAKEAGLQKSDKILAIDGEKILYWRELLKKIRSTGKKTLNLTIYRPEVGKMNFQITPKIKKMKNLFGQEKEIPLIGISPSGEITNIKYPFLQAVYKGTNYITEATYLSIKGIWNLIIGNIALKKSATGPVGIFYLTSKVAEEGVRNLFKFIAFISMTLAIVNLIPFPPLDGGHVLFLAVEKIKGSPINTTVMQALLYFGFFILIVLLLYISYYDILRFFIGK